MAKNMTMEELFDEIGKLSYNDFKKIVDYYSKNTNDSFEKEMKQLVSASLQHKLLQHGINTTCPHCGLENVVKRGTRNNIQILYCKDCENRFTPFTNTILEKSRWHWDIWVKVLEMTINNYSLDAMVHVLEDDYGCDGIDRKTVWRWRLKLIHALASLPQPVLTGVIQVDETLLENLRKVAETLYRRLVKMRSEA